MVPERFNVRVYGIWINEGQLLINEEIIRGRTVIKFPGGGLDPGEGTRDCLIREWKEELGLDINVLDHFYTTDFYQPSAFDNSQVISIYYRVSAEKVPLEIVNLVEQERTFWIPLGDLRRDTFSLPIDQVVGEMLCRLHKISSI